MSRIFLAVVFSFAIAQVFAQTEKRDRWVDSVFSKLNTTEKIGQTIIVPFSSGYTKEDIKILDDHIKASKVGGLFIFRSSPTPYAHLINQFQSRSEIPLFISNYYSDDLQLTFDSVMSFYDYQKMELLYDKSIEDEVVRERKTLGINVDLKHALLTTGSLMPIPAKEIDASIKRVSKALKKDKALAKKLDETVKEILKEKYDAGLAQNRFINTENLIERLNSQEAHLLKQQLAQSLVAVVKNDSSFLPIKNLYGRTFASVSIGDSDKNEFTHYLSKYAFFQNYSIQKLEDTVGLTSKVKKADVIVVSLYKKEDSLLIDPFKKLTQQHAVIVCDFSEWKKLKSLNGFSSILFAHSSEQGIPQAAAQIIFGGLGAKDELPIIDSLQKNRCIKIDHIDRFSYQLPEAAGLDSRTLNKIEAIANESITIGATPGINVLVAKDGKVVYEKSFGSLTYDKKNPMTDETIFDLASVTKVSATLQAVMYMQEKGMIDINKKASVYLPELKGTNKEDFTIKDIITHQAGLWPFVPYWAETVKDSSIWKKYYSKTESSDYPFPVSENLFASKSMKDSLWQWTIKSKVVEKTVRTPYGYRYSDMAFYIMMHIAEKLLKMPLEDFLQKNIYQPLGASTTGYLPLRKFSVDQIAPTEKDTLFRKSLLIGYVHDQGAAMHGGIAGHAGLFSNANDLAKLGQMWLNKGSYGGIQFFKPETIDFFAAKQYENSRRGLGWDKPVLNEPQPSPTSFYSSAKTFGHTGFTGTCIWVDPEFNLVFVFLSNRVYPNMYNNKILTSNIRQRIHDVVYQSIFEYCKNHGEPLKPNEPKFGLTVKP